MINFSEVIIGKKVFFRGPTSRKPYKVEIVGVHNLFLSTMDRSVRYSELTDEELENMNTELITDANLRVRFTNGDEDVISIRFLFHSWDQAARIGPIRPPRVMWAR